MDTVRLDFATRSLQTGATEIEVVHARVPSHLPGIKRIADLASRLAQRLHQGLLMHGRKHSRFGGMVVVGKHRVGIVGASVDPHSGAHAPVVFGFGRRVGKTAQVCMDRCLLGSSWRMGSVRHQAVLVGPVLDTRSAEKTWRAPRPTATPNTPAAIVITR